MKYFICVFIILTTFACSESEQVPLIQRDMPTDQRMVPDMGTDTGKDVADDLSDVPRFPDPNREGTKACKKSLDCKRFEYCTSIEDCSFGRGCGVRGRLPRAGGREDVGCIIDESGVGEITGAECTSDEMCPSDMPYCYLKACQTQPRCTVDAECEATQFCDYELWCATLPPCERDTDCNRGRCGEDNICDYSL